MKKILEMLIHRHEGKWWTVHTHEGENPATSAARMFVWPELLTYIRHKLSKEIPHEETKVDP